QPEAVLELGDAKLQLVVVVARHEVQLLREHAESAEALLGELRAAASEPGRQLAEQLLERVDEPLATARGHAASCAAAAAASLGAPAPTAPTATATRRRRAPASARRPAPPPTPPAPRCRGRPWRACARGRPLRGRAPRPYRRAACASRTPARAPSTW